MTVPAKGSLSGYLFDDITLDVDRRRVIRGDAWIQVGKLTYELLLVLAERAPRVVTQKELVERLWGGRFVSPETVKQRIMLLRQALSDDAGHPRYIEVVRGQGYRLIPDVEPLTGESPSPVWKRPAFVAATLAVIGLAVIIGIYWSYPDSLDTTDVEILPNSVAVLLCDNLSPNPDDAYFAASIHEEILNQLVKIRALNVIARTSVLRYANDPPPVSQIAEELRVESVMKCSVRYAGDAVLVTAQLIDPETNLHLWSDTYPGDRSDISAMFEMQADIAMNIANALQAEFSVAEQASLARQLTDSPAAYELYMRAIRSLHYQDRETALLLFMQAIDLDPEFAAAYGRLALATAPSLVQTFGNPAVEPGERVRLESEVRRAVDQALRLDPNPVFASASALIDMYYWNWAEADQAFERALETSPNNTFVLVNVARLRSFQGMHEDAIEFMQRVVQLNPNGGGAHYILASVLAHSGDSEAALAPAREAVNLSAGNPVTHLWLARIGSALDLDDEVAEHLSIAERLLIDSATPVGLASLAFTYSLIGYEEDASRILEQLDAATPDRDFDAGSWVLGYLAQGDEDAAYEALQTVIERVERNEPDAAYWNLMIIKSNAQRHPVLDTPRFEDLRNRIGTSN